ncbi:MAG: hypothetical protein Q3986_03990 [Akkermansia sp.]|nr:hypothetical protein [Akkermansia sp.]
MTLRYALSLLLAAAMLPTVAQDKPAAPTPPAAPAVPAAANLQPEVKSYVLLVTAAIMEKTAELYEQGAEGDIKRMLAEVTAANLGVPTDKLPEAHRAYLAERHAVLRAIVQEVQAMENATDAAAKAVVDAHQGEFKAIDAKYPEPAAALNERMLNKTAHELMIQGNIGTQAIANVMAHPEIAAKGQKATMIAYYREAARLLREAASL